MLNMPGTIKMQMWGNDQVSGFLQSPGGSDSSWGWWLLVLTLVPACFPSPLGSQPSAPAFLVPIAFQGKVSCPLPAGGPPALEASHWVPGQDLGAFCSQGGGWGSGNSCLRPLISLTLGQSLLRVPPRPRQEEEVGGRLGGYLSSEKHSSPWEHRATSPFLSPPLPQNPANCSLRLPGVMPAPLPSLQE